MGPEGDATEQVRQRMGPEHFDAFVANANLLLERSVLRDPTDEEVPAPQQSEWNPAGAAAVAIKRAEEEQAQSGRLNEEGGRWRRGRLRDVIAARELLIKSIHGPAVDFEVAADRPHQCAESQRVATTTLTCIDRRGRKRSF
jgi:hypothetical protein